MTPALRWAAMRAILMFHSLWGPKPQDSVHKNEPSFRCSLYLQNAPTPFNHDHEIDPPLPPPPLCLPRLNTFTSRSLLAASVQMPHPAVNSDPSKNVIFSHPLTISLCGSGKRWGDAIVRLRPVQSWLPTHSYRTLGVAPARGAISGHPEPGCRVAPASASVTEQPTWVLLAYFLSYFLAGGWVWSGWEREGLRRRCPTIITWV